MDQKQSLTNSLLKTLRREYARGCKQLYFDSIVRESKLPSETVEKLLIDQFQSGVVDGSLMLRCPECGQDLGMYKRLTEVPEESVCYVCEARIPRSFDYVDLLVNLRSDTFFRKWKRQTPRANRPSL